MRRRTNEIGVDLGTGGKGSRGEWGNEHTLEQNIIKNIGIVSTMIVTD